MAALAAGRAAVGTVCAAMFRFEDMRHHLPKNAMPGKAADARRLAILWCCANAARKTRFKFKLWWEAGDRANLFLRVT
ncbi:hypothetical protein ACFWXH_30200 [Mesorhizobium sp. NPDC059054]|uniref:hypothetical protein n=1 Tax=Mesorhizobium sp. NPDC059054 TaxID=3346711 RepID=UPI00367BA544